MFTCTIIILNTHMTKGKLFQTIAAVCEQNELITQVLPRQEQKCLLPSIKKIHSFQMGDTLKEKEFSLLRAMSYLKELVPIENRAIKIKLLTLKVYQFALIELSIFPILISAQYCFDFLFVFMFWYHDRNINIIVVQKTFP